MNDFLASSLVALALSSCQGTSAAEAPDLSKSLAETGKRTFEKLENTPATWTTRCGAVDVKVFSDGRRRSWSVSKSVHGSPSKSVHGSPSNVCDIIEVDGVWHVMSSGYFLKCRPYEADLRFPAAYLVLALADIRNFAEKNPFGTLEFEKRKGSQLWFRLRPIGEHRRVLETILAESSRLKANDLTFEQRRRQEATAIRARERLADGTPVVFDEQTGLLLEGELQSIPFSVEGFRWLDRLPEDAFALPKGVRWNDQTRPWSAKECEDCVLIAHDRFFVEGEPSSPDTFILNLKSGDMRRVPFVGLISLPCCFVASRSAAVVAGVASRSAAAFAGTDPNSSMRLARVDLVTGTNESFAADWVSGGPLFMGEVSPDGQYALGLNPSLSDMETETEIRLIKLSDRSIRTLRTGRLGGSLSWLPDGNGIVLKRFEPVKRPNQFGRPVLCRLDLDGTLKDLTPGNWPLVLRKSRRILYQDNDSQLWHTCDLDGSNPKLYADGLAGHGQPAVSPDERQILFTRFSKERAPQLMLFELGKSDGQPATLAEGYTGNAVWR